MVHGQSHCVAPPASNRQGMIKRTSATPTRVEAIQVFSTRIYIFIRPCTTMVSLVIYRTWDMYYFVEFGMFKLASCVLFILAPRPFYLTLIVACFPWAVMIYLDYRLFDISTVVLLVTHCMMCVFSLLTWLNPVKPRGDYYTA